MLPIIRFGLLFAILFLISIFIIRKRKIKFFYGSKNVIFYLILISVITQISRMPFENLFVKYDSTDNAFFWLGKGDNLGTEEGKESCLIIVEKDSERSYIYLNKENEYFKAPFFEPKRKIVKFDNQVGIRVTLIQEKGTDNYYVVLLATSSIINVNQENYITDSNSSDFKRILFLDKKENNYFFQYSAYVENMSDDYFIKINDNEYKVF